VRHRRLHGWVPAVLLLLIAVSPAVHAQDAGRRSLTGGSAAIRDVDASLTGMSAAIAERVPGPGVRPLQGVPADGIAVLMVLTWVVLGFAGVTRFDRAVRARRDRAPPRRLLVRV
jgi:hypothetical protein